jgi:hypothetical protein
MSTEEFERWMAELVSQGRLDADQAADLVAQRRRFDGVRESLTVSYHDKVVGFRADEMLVADSVSQLLEEAPNDGRLVYFEPIEYNAFGGGA